MTPSAPADPATPSALSGSGSFSFHDGIEEFCFAPSADFVRNMSKYPFLWPASLPVAPTPPRLFPLALPLLSPSTDPFFSTSNTPMPLSRGICRLNVHTLRCSLLSVPSPSPPVRKLTVASEDWRSLSLFRLSLSSLSTGWMSTKWCSFGEEGVEAIVVAGFVRPGEDSTKEPGATD